MNSPSFQGFFLVCTVLLSIPTLQVIVVLVQLLAALISGTAKWPGPVIHDPNPRVTLGRRNIGLRPDRLFPEFVQSALALTASFVFFLLLFISGTPSMADRIHINWTCITYFVLLIAFISGIVNFNKAAYHRKQVRVFLFDIAKAVEPRHIDGSSVEAEYAIEHPLIEQKGQTSEFLRALQLFWDGTTYFQSGNRMQAATFYQQALEIDPSLHQHAREALSGMAQDCSPKEAGPIYYWLGAHSEYLMDLAQAKSWYEKASAAFHQIGYPKRESRVHCNLGNVKMRMMDESAMQEFEHAVALNPKNGFAHINIGTAYYHISERGDPRFEKALNAYADAIIADPVRYGPIVIARIREYSYTWKEDLEDITQRVERKRSATS